MCFSFHLSVSVDYFRFNKETKNHYVKYYPKMKNPNQMNKFFGIVKTFVKESDKINSVRMWAVFQSPEIQNVQNC